MKLITFLSLLTLVFYFFVPTAFAKQKSSYVLPYPGIMPGSKLYIVSIVTNQLEDFYTFGDFAKIKFYQAQADKYLVEAKTLFEYGQFKLAISSLEKSNKYYKKIYPLIRLAKENGKEISEKEKNYVSASQKHTEELIKIKDFTPEQFIWADEKKPSITLDIKKALDYSIMLRNE